MAEIVYGPGRPLAAYRVLAELEALREKVRESGLGVWSDYPLPQAMSSRLAELERQAGEYSEYADLSAAYARV